MFWLYKFIQIKMLLFTNSFVMFMLFGNVMSKVLPKFVGDNTNVTAVVGRDATLTCVIENLQNFKVAWLRVDTQTVLSIGTHVITKNPRISVTRVDGSTWTLAVRSVRVADGGRYMCQINTEPMSARTHHLQVVVPPDIVNTSGEVLVREGENASLYCSASGTPQPKIIWRREDGAAIKVGNKNFPNWNGEWLNLTAVNRIESGAFYCIATNGVPPSVSNRILLRILCKPSVKIIQKVIGGYLGNTVQIQCSVESYPVPNVYWTHDVNKLNNGSKYEMSILTSSYKHTAVLRVNNISREDIGSYQCHAQNPLGSVHDDVTIYTLATTTIMTTSTTELFTTTEEALTTTAKILETTEIQTTPIEDVGENVVIVLSQHQMQNYNTLPTS